MMKFNTEFPSRRNKKGNKKKMGIQTPNFPTLNFGGGWAGKLQSYAHP